jgi:hypothetical protein
MTEKVKKKDLLIARKIYQWFLIIFVLVRIHIWFFSICKQKLFTDPDEHNWKVSIKHRKFGDKSFNKEDQKFDTEHDLPLEFPLSSDHCQVIQLRVRVQSQHDPKAKKEVKLPDFQFGPKSLIEEIEITDLQPNSVKVRWTSIEQECASGFKIR